MKKCRWLAGQVRRRKGKRMILDIPLHAKPTSDKMALLMSELQTATALTKERQSGHWIGIHNRNLRSLLGGNYRGVIDDCIAAGFIEENKRYSKGRFPKSYRLATPYRIPQIQQYSLKRVKTKLRSKIRIDSSDSVGMKLVNSFGAFEVPTSTSVTGWDLYSVRSIWQRQWYSTRCEYGRFHSSFTGLPKRIREKIRIEGKPVVETDVSNCQPLIIGILTNLQSTDKHRTNSTTNPYGAQISGHSDVKRYLELCAKGDLYDFLLDGISHLTLHHCIPIHYRHKHAVDRPLNRADVKSQFLVMMFCSNEMMKRQPLFKIVEREFPTVAHFLESAKRTEYQDLARSCQRFESRIVIDSVAADLVARWPIITIHDSIISSEDHADDVANMFRAKFAEFGIEVKVKQGF